jgi:hypothetical protein
MSRRFLMNVFFIFFFSMQASQWEKISVFSYNGGVIGYRAQSVKNNESLLIVRFGSGNYSGVKKVEAHVSPMDNRGQNELKEKFKKLALLWEAQQIKKLKAHL